jgi:hypothetical protein
MNKPQTPGRVGKDSTPRPLAGKREERIQEIARKYPQLPLRTPTTKPKG